MLLSQELLIGNPVVTALFDSIPDAIVIMNEKGRIIFVNSQVEKLFGYTRNELLQQPLELLVPKRHAEKHRNHTAGFKAWNRAVCAKIAPNSPLR
jgi:protein-histidine pros-kinase